jgi:hypothetical protein
MELRGETYSLYDQSFWVSNLSATRFMLPRFTFGGHGLIADLGFSFVHVGLL